MLVRAPARSIPSQAIGAAGYLSILIAPALLGLASVLDLPYLTFGVVMLVYPLLRSVFGAVPAGPRPAPHRRVVPVLDRLGTVYCVAIAVAVTLLLHRLHSVPPGPAGALGWMASVWVTLVFGTCVAHNLLHLREQPERLLGHLLAGVMGYPILGYEHSRHHNLPGSTKAAEWPRMDENVWTFTWRRMRAIFPETLGRGGLLVAGNVRSPMVRGLRVATSATVVMLSLFAVSAGWTGAAVYSGAALLVTVAIQIITYLQHWGPRGRCPRRRTDGGV